MTTSARAAHVEALGAGGDVYTLEVGAEFAWSPRWSSAAVLPSVVIRPEDGQPEQVGLGNAQLLAKWLLSEPSPLGSPWAVEFFAGVPTRTAVLGLDPGPVWGFGTLAQYSLRLDGALMQARAGVAGDARRAGVALEAVYSAQFVQWLSDTWAVAVAGIGATRAATWCRMDRQWSFCAEGRSSELRTRTSATALSAQLALEAALWEDGGLRASGRLPVTARRDSEWATTLLLIFGF